MSRLRTCEVNGQKGYFHKWITCQNVVDPSPLVGGHPGGQISVERGIVEYEDGTVREVYPGVIRFTDGGPAE